MEKKTFGQKTFGQTLLRNGKNIRTKTFEQTLLRNGKKHSDKNRSDKRCSAHFSALR
jgi:hypothetical protein